MTTQIVALITDAAAAVARAFPTDAAERLQEVADRGDLLLEVIAYPDGGVFGEFFDLGVPPCWDHCNGITTEHRHGWCRVNPEHADLDCYCGIPPEAWDDDYDPDECPAGGPHVYREHDESPAGPSRVVHCVECDATPPPDPAPAFVVVAEFAYDPDNEPF